MSEVRILYVFVFPMHFKQELINFDAFTLFFSYFKKKASGLI